MRKKHNSDKPEQQEFLHVHFGWVQWLSRKRVRHFSYSASHQRLLLNTTKHRNLPVKAVLSAVPATAWVLLSSVSTIICPNSADGFLTLQQIGSWQVEQKDCLLFRSADRLSSPGMCLPGRSPCCQKALKEFMQLQSPKCRTACAHNALSSLLKRLILDDVTCSSWFVNISSSWTWHVQNSLNM